MTATEKRNSVKNAVISREGKNSYTQQSNLREQVANGYSDCSSLQQWAYHQIGVEIGSYTGAQICAGEWVTQGGEYPDKDLLQPGDELFFRATYANGRAYNVGHIEMYIGNSQISGHGSGIGPTRKNMVEYCRSRNQAGGNYIGVKRYIANDGSESQNSNPNTSLADAETMFVGSCAGDDVNVRKGPSATYENIEGWPKLNKGNLFEVLEKTGSWYRIKIAKQHIGYIYGQYVQEVKGREDIDDGFEIFVGACTGDNVNVRKGPGMEFANIISWPTLNKGNLVDVIGSEGDWYKIKIANQYTGYIAKNYIK